MRIVLTIISLCFTIVLSAQIKDNTNKSTRIPAVEVEKEVNTDSKDLNLHVIENDNLPLSMPIKKFTDSVDFSQSKSKGFTMLQDNNLVNPGVIYEEKWREKKPPVEAGMQYEKKQYFGEHKITSKYLKILYRDFQAVDGDVIRVFSNDDVIVPRAYLNGGFQGYKLDLVDGFNKIDFLALNQGDSGPNTAEFMIVDDKDQVVYNNAWNLATGGIATIIFVKE